ncbi:HNH endonuclease, partial [Mycobacterium sp. C31M]
MDAACLESFLNALIDDLTPSAVPDADVGRTLFHLLDCPRIVDEPALLSVLVAAVTGRNLFDFVIASAVAAAERLGVPARKRLK